MAQPVFDNISLENPLLRVYWFYSSILVLKMLFMSLLTARRRFKNMAFANPEDCERYKLKVKVDEDVERVRRAHLNDLENIPIFLFVSFGYLFTNPSVFLATTLFRAFTIARIVHTIVYAIVVIPQPARALSFGVGVLVTGYMAVARNVFNGHRVDVALDTDVSSAIAADMLKAGSLDCCRKQLSLREPALRMSPPMTDETSASSATSTRSVSENPEELIENNHNLKEVS